MFIGSTLHAYYKGDKEISTSQKVTGALELSGIIGVTVLALLIIANNSSTFAVPGLNSMSNLSSAIMLGSAVPLLVLNLVALIIYQKITEKKKAVVETPQLPPLPAPNINALEQQLETKQAQLLKLQQDKGRLEAEKSALALKVQGLEAGQAQLLKMKPKADPEITKNLESQKTTIESLQKDKKILEENLDKLGKQLATQSHTATNERQTVLEQCRELQQRVIAQNQKIAELSQKEKELETLKAQLQQGQLAGNANAGDKANFEAEKKRLEEEFAQREGNLRKELQTLQEQKQKLHKKVQANKASNDQSTQKQLQQKSEKLREYELKTLKLESEIASLKKQLQQAAEGHAENQARLTKEQEEARTQSQLKIQELQKQLDESAPKRRNVEELKIAKEEKDKIREQLLAPKNVRKTKEEIAAEIAKIEATANNFLEASQKAQQEEAAGANQRTTTTTTTTSASTAPQPTGGPPPPNGLRPPPPGGAPTFSTNGNGTKTNGSQKTQAPRTNGKEKSESAGPPTPEELKARIAQSRRNAENSNVPAMTDGAKKALHIMFNSSDPDAALQLKLFKEVVGNIIEYLKDKELKADFSLDSPASMNTRMQAFVNLPDEIRKYFVSLRNFIIQGAELSDRKARAKACRLLVEKEILLTKVEESKTPPPDSLVAILLHAMSGMRPGIEGQNDTPDDDDDEWKD